MLDAVGSTNGLSSVRLVFLGVSEFALSIKLKSAVGLRNSSVSIDRLLIYGRGLILVAPRRPSRQARTEELEVNEGDEQVISFSNPRMTS